MTFPVEILSEQLSYDPINGRITWLKRSECGKTGHALRGVRTFNARRAGKSALTADDGKGYLCGIVNGRSVKAHRVAWALHYGAWPKGEIDHINGNRADNRIENLRVVDSATNNRNRKKPTNNTSGHIGIRWSDRHSKWLVRIGVNGSLKFVGLYGRLENAIDARKRAEVAAGFHQNHGRA